MLTNKQIQKLKSLAHPLRPVLQIGKNGFHEDLINDILNYLNKHELMKVSILKNFIFNEYEAKEWFKEAGITYVSKIGRGLILYKYSSNISNHVLEN